MHKGRRRFLKGLAIAPIVGLSACNKPRTLYGPLTGPDKNSIRLPTRFHSRVIAHSTQQVAGLSYVWHGAPDGGGTIALEDKGWLYISNSELGDGRGGVSVIRFDQAGAISDAYSILANTSRNCGGCVTPWGSWLSCEEIRQGQVWECDPMGRSPAQARPALGVFMHESAAVDKHTNQVYLTEDEKDGGFYRFTPSSKGKDALANGVLEVAQMDEGRLYWHKVPDPQAKAKPVRYQVGKRFPFKGGEGIWIHNNKVYFTTKHDNRVWEYSLKTGKISLLYDQGQSGSSLLRGVDGIISDKYGNLLVAEDGGDLRIVMIKPSGELMPLIQLADHGLSEVTGLAFSPDFTRLYFSSQRGYWGSSQDGRTYEVSGPF